MIERSARPLAREPDCRQSSLVDKLLTKFSDYRACKVLIDFAVARHGLRYTTRWVVVPVVFATVADQHASHLRDLTD
jgi:hypothetical protein